MLKRSSRTSRAQAFAARRGQRQRSEASHMVSCQVPARDPLTSAPSGVDLKVRFAQDDRDLWVNCYIISLKNAFSSGIYECSIQGDDAQGISVGDILYPWKIYNQQWTPTVHVPVKQAQGEELREVNFKATNK